MKRGNRTLTKEPSFLFYGSMHFFIHSYPNAVLVLLFVTGLAKKLYKILHTISVFFQKYWHPPICAFLWIFLDSSLKHSPVLCLSLRINPACLFQVLASRFYLLPKPNKQFRLHAYIKLNIQSLSSL